MKWDTKLQFEDKERMPLCYNQLIMRELANSCLMTLKLLVDYVKRNIRR